MRSSSDDRMIHVRPRVEVTVKVKANMQFKKIFEVAEVFGAAHSALTRALMFLIQKRFGKDPGALPSTFAKTQESRPGCM